MTVSVGEDLEEGDGVGAVGHVWVQAEFFAESNPDLPVARGGLGATRNDSLGDVRLSKAEVIPETIPGGGLNKCQGCVCG